MPETTQRPSRPIAAGDTIPEQSLQITLRRLVINVGASWDFFPGHYDTDYARANGHATVFANTSLFLGFADRVITDWAGPGARIAQRKLTMHRPIEAGETMHAGGVVTGCRVEHERGLVELELQIRNDEELCAHASATLELPPEQESGPVPQSP
jgi:acyl dehydratase